MRARMLTLRRHWLRLFRGCKHCYCMRAFLFGILAMSLFSMGAFASTKKSVGSRTHSSSTHKRSTNSGHHRSSAGSHRGSSSGKSNIPTNPN
jgi:hypothetical protein